MRFSDRFGQKIGFFSTCRSILLRRAEQQHGIGVFGEPFDRAVGPAAIIGRFDLDDEAVILGADHGMVPRRGAIGRDRDKVLSLIDQVVEPIVTLLAADRESELEPLVGSSESDESDLVVAAQIVVERNEPILHFRIAFAGFGIDSVFPEIERVGDLRFVVAVDQIEVVLQCGQIVATLRCEEERRGPIEPLADDRYRGRTDDFAFGIADGEHAVVVMHTRLVVEQECIRKPCEVVKRPFVQPDTSEYSVEIEFQHSFAGNVADQYGRIGYGGKTQVESLLWPSSARRGGGNIALFVEKYDFVSIGNNKVICNVRDVTWVFSDQHRGFGSQWHDLHIAVRQGRSFPLNGYAVIVRRKFVAASCEKT